MHWKPSFCCKMKMRVSFFLKRKEENTVTDFLNFKVECNCSFNFNISHSDTLTQVITSGSFKSFLYSRIIHLECDCLHRV